MTPTLLTTNRLDRQHERRWGDEGDVKAGVIPDRARIRLDGHRLVEHVRRGPVEVLSCSTFVKQLLRIDQATQLLDAVCKAEGRTLQYY